MHTMLTMAAAPLDATTVERIRTSPLAWVVSGVLMVAALFFIIRLLEWDLINEETPNQDDPLPR